MVTRCGRLFRPFSGHNIEGHTVSYGCLFIRELSPPTFIIFHVLVGIALFYSILSGCNELKDVLWKAKGWTNDISLINSECRALSLNGRQSPMMALEVFTMREIPGSD